MELHAGAAAWRLAFEDLLPVKGALVSWTLDDPLAYSDDGGLESMTEILREALNTLWVITPHLQRRGLPPHHRHTHDSWRFASMNGLTLATCPFVLEAH
ncbi:hypothetical protein [Mesorhizobium sp.]|uniref:hypothetical protein n=1 Tax=Mesorhizobium sp. TaxID=1871066 RepID=UPI00122B9E01|nr:hypothetical protein [Mesorhizobium sp.]TIL68471.1 MAG: hypothetical protein E5Y77_08885 [Mesorhizobium sp.]